MLISDIIVLILEKKGLKETELVIFKNNIGPERLSFFVEYRVRKA